MIKLVRSNVFKKVIIAILSSILLLAPLGTLADIPVIDPAEILQIIKEGIQAAERFEKAFNQRVQQLTLSGLVGDRNIQNENNIGANTIIRLTQNSTDIFNKQLLMNSQPAITACSTDTLANSLNDNFCIVQSLVNRITDDQTNLSQGGDPSKPFMQNMIGAVNSTVTQQHNLVTESGNQNAGLNSNAFMNPQLGGYTETQQKEADFNRQLILNPLPQKNPIPNNRRLKKNLSFVEQKERVGQDVYTARKSVAATALATIQAENTKDKSGVSKIGMMQKFVKDRFLSKDWIEKITNTHPNKTDKSNVTTQAQVIREIALMDSFNNYMNLQLKKSSDQQTILLATILSTILDSNNARQ